MSQGSRNFYAVYNMINDNCPNVLKSVLVFKSKQKRDDFLKSKKDKSKWYATNRDDAFIIANLNEKNKIPCVHKSYVERDTLFVLADIRNCWGSWYQRLSDFDVHDK